MEDAGLPLLPHGVGGGAEEGPVVHGVLGGVAQAALSTFALGSLVGDPEHYTVSGQHQRGTVICHLVTPSPLQVHFLQAKFRILMRRPVWYLWWWLVVH